MALKILYIASGTKMAGGATKSFLAMLREAKKAGFEYEIVCPDEEGLTKYLRENGEKVHVVHFRHVCLPSAEGLTNIIKWAPRIVHNYWINLKARHAVTEIARKYSPDIIHENSSVINVGYHAAKSLGLPDVVHIREYGDLDFQMILPGRDERLADESVYTISITKDIARHKKQDSNPRATQIYNGIVKENQFRYNSKKDQYFLYAGRIESAKGISDLLKAYIYYTKQVEKSLPLYIAGGTNHPSYLKSLQSYVIEHGCGDKVKWLGERKDIADLAYNATATIIPSRFEGLGRVMPEAMTNGCLCVGRNTGGTKEQMENGKKYTGKDIAISYDTEEQLIDILVQITQKVENSAPFEIGGEYQVIIQNSMNSVKKFFSEESFGVQLRQFYHKIMADRIQASSQKN